MVIEFPWWIYPVLLWTLIWKGIGAWKAARNGQLLWFVSFFVFNTGGILPIVYLVWFQGRFGTSLSCFPRGSSRKKQDWNKRISKKRKASPKEITRVSPKKTFKKSKNKFRKKFPSLP